jgi:hypothetical protein
MVASTLSDKTWDQLGEPKPWFEIPLVRIQVFPFEHNQLLVRPNYYAPGGVRTWFADDLPSRDERLQMNIMETFSYYFHSMQPWPPPKMGFRVVGYDGHPVLFVSKWLIAIILTVCYVPLALVTGRTLRMSVRRRRGLCEHCGYSRQGLVSTRCPECGSIPQKEIDVRA